MKKETSPKELHSKYHEITQYKGNEQNPYDCFYISKLLVWISIKSIKYLEQTIA